MKPEHIPLMPRYGEIARLQSYVESKQYEGRPDFWTGLKGGKGGEVVPLRERAPCIVYPLPRATAQQVVRFTFGEGRFPTLNVEPQEDADAAVYESLALGDEEAAVLERGLVDVVENAMLKSVMRTLMTRGLTERTAVAIASIKNGRVTFDLPHAKDCWPTFRNDDPADELLAVTWAYTFTKTVIENERAVCKRFWFRRDVTAEAYVTFEPVEVKPGTAEVEWGTGVPTPHGYGFCPALWIRNLDDTSEPGGIDGISLLEDLFDEFDALNFALSQRHRGITFFGTPQPYETGVEPGDGPDADGRTSNGYSASTSPTGLMAEGTKGSARPHGAAKQAARRMSPDRVWSYEGQNVKVGMIEAGSAWFDNATKHVEDIRGRCLETMSVVLASIEQTLASGGEMNATFLKLAYAPLLNLVDELRDATWWPFGLRAMISLCLRILAKEGGKGILIPNAVKLGELVKRFEVPVQGADGKTVTVWMLPKITPSWGEAFSPSTSEIAEGVSAATSAKDGGLIPLKPAVAYVAKHFAIDDVDAAVEELEALAEEQKQIEAEQAQAQADDAHAKQLEASDAGHAQQLDLVKAKATAAPPKAKAKPKPTKRPAR